MIRLCNFIEYGCNNGVSIKDSACQQSYPEKQKIVSYLKNELISIHALVKRATALQSCYR